jgi:hypothetical protein
MKLIANCHIGEWVAFSINLPSVGVTGTHTGAHPLATTSRKQGERNERTAQPHHAAVAGLLARGSLHRSDPQQVIDQAGRGSISVSWASHQDEVRQAQRLRFDVFALEMGARLNTAMPWPRRRPV